jgi:hypothetical protein
LPLSQFSHGELTMRDIRPTLFIDGCSRLANSSQERNKIFRKFCAIWTVKTRHCGRNQV